MQIAEDAKFLHADNEDSDQTATKDTLSHIVARLLPYLLSDRHAWTNCVDSAQTPDNV